MNTTTTYKDTDEAWEAGNEWIRQSDRWEKLDFLMETASLEFNEFFNHLRRNWDIKTPQELDYAMNS